MGQNDLFVGSIDIVTGLPGAVASPPGQLSAWPNPARTALHVSVPAAAHPPARFELRDVLGRLVRTATTATGAAELAVADLPAGVYVVRAEWSAGQASRRVVVEP